MFHLRPVSTLLVLCAASFGQFQTNQAAASLTINGVATSGATAATSSIALGTGFELQVSSINAGRPYDIALNSLPQLQPGFGFASQLINLDFFGGFAFLSNGGTFTVPGLPFGTGVWSQSFTHTPTALGTTTFQMYVVDPAQSGGLALSQAATLTVNSIQRLALNEDGFSRQALAVPFSFYGVQYNECFVGSNGLVTFGAGNPSGAGNPLAFFSAQEASIPMLWVDLDPTSGGTVEFSSDYTTGVNTVSFSGVPLFGGDPTLGNTFSTRFGPGLIQTTYGVLTTPTALIGLSPGANAIGPWLVDLSSANASPIAIPYGSSPFEFFFFTGVDLAGSTLSFALDSIGTPTRIN